MIIEHIKASDFETNQWSAGTTTQLAIYPKDAEYSKRNFLFRISTATVESDESNFTKLPGINRKLMILEGEIKIEHQNQYTKILKKFEQDQFSGNWETKSYGKAIDFNLMTRENASGDIEAIIIDDSKKIILNTSHDFYAIYIYTGESEVFIENKSIIANKGDLVFIQQIKENEKIELTSSNKCEIILSKIWLRL